MGLGILLASQCQASHGYAICLAAAAVPVLLRLQYALPFALAHMDDGFASLCSPLRCMDLPQILRDACVFCACRDEMDGSVSGSFFLSNPSIFIYQSLSPAPRSPALPRCWLAPRPSRHAARAFFIARSKDRRIRCPFARQGPRSRCHAHFNTKVLPNHRANLLLNSHWLLFSYTPLAVLSE